MRFFFGDFQSIRQLLINPDTSLYLFSFGCAHTRMKILYLDDRLFFSWYFGFGFLFGPTRWIHVAKCSILYTDFLLQFMALILTIRVKLLPWFHFFDTFDYTFTNDLYRDYIVNWTHTHTFVDLIWNYEMKLYIQFYIYLSAERS